MPTTDGISYHTHADLLSSGTTIEFNVSDPERITVRISAVEEVLPYIPGFPGRVPEYNAIFLYPAYKEKFLGIFRQRPTNQRRERELPLYVISHIFSMGNLQELLDLVRRVQIDYWEKLKAYMAFSQQNIFANREVPTSFRLIHEATGLPPDRVLQLVREDADGTFSVVAGQFLLPVRGIDL